MHFELHSTIAIILGIALVQTCQSIDNQTMEKYKEYYSLPDLNSYLDGSDAIKDINPEFVEDVQIILEKFRNNPYVTTFILSLMDALANTFHGKKSKITTTAVYEHVWAMDYVVYDECWVVDSMNIAQSILLKQLPLERISGVINLCCVLTGNGSGKDLYEALGYLYGIVARPITTIPLLTQKITSNPQNCTDLISTKTRNDIQTLTYAIKLMNSTKLNPKVLSDVQIIAEKFPYNFEVYHLLQIMEELLIELENKNSAIDICELKNQNRWLGYTHYTEPAITFKMIDLEITLSTRVPEENFMDLLNLIRASYRIDGSDWTKAVEYAYDAEYFNSKECKQYDASNITTTP